jgi:very-short-patch-repair endonuclease
MRDTESKSRTHAKRLRKEMTKAEIILWGKLRQLNLRGFKFRRQHPIGPYIADFVHIRGRLVIEIDGATHWTAERAAHDRRRDAFLDAEGWNVLRIADKAVYEDLSGVVDDIIRRLPLT